MFSPGIAGDGWHFPPGPEIAQTFPQLEAHAYFANVTNMVATCKIGVPVTNFATWIEHAQCLEFSASQPSTIALRLDRIMSRYYTSSKETSGVFVLTACKSYHQALYAMQQLRLLVEGMQAPVLVCDPGIVPHFELSTMAPFAMFHDFKIVNVVAAGLVSDTPIELFAILRAYSEIGAANWEPEKFPAAKLTIKSHPEECPLSISEVTAHLFDTGKYVIMGGRYDSDIFIAHEYLERLVKGYTDVNLPRDTLKRTSYRKNQLLYGQHHARPVKRARGERDDEGEVVEEDMDAFWSALPSKETASGEQDLDDLLYYAT